MTLPRSHRQKYPQEVIDLLNKAKSTDEVDKILQFMVDAGLITDQNEIDRLYTDFAPVAARNALGLNKAPSRNLADFGFSKDVTDYLNLFTSSDDLADRLNNITGLDDNTKADIWDVIIGGRTDAELNRAPDIALRQSRAKATIEQDKSRLASQKAQSQYFQGITPRLNQILNNKGLSAEDRGIISQTQRPEFYMPPEIRERYIAQQQATGGATGMSGQAFADYLDEWNRYGEANLINQYNKGQQQNQAVMNAFSGNQDFTGTSRDPRNTWNPEELTKDTGKFVETYLDSYAPGRIKSYIESQIPGLMADTAKDRQHWLDMMNPRTAGYGMAGGGYGADMSYWQDQIRNNTELAGALPSDTTLGDTYWGEGGPAEVARRAAEGAQFELDRTKALAAQSGYGSEEDNAYREMEAQNRADYRKTEDPFKKALRSKDWLTGYYRMPGTGISSRLAPRVRFI